MAFAYTNALPIELPRLTEARPGLEPGTRGSKITLVSSAQQDEIIQNENSLSRQFDDKSVSVHLGDVGVGVPSACVEDSARHEVGQRLACGAQGEQKVLRRGDGVREVLWVWFGPQNAS